MFTNPRRNALLFAMGRCLLVPGRVYNLPVGSLQTTEMRISSMKVTQFGLCAALLFGATAFSAPISYFTILNGLNESPPNASPGTGSAFVTIDTVAHSLVVSVD